MQAIATKVIPATNTRPTRIKAECARGSFIIPYPDTVTGEAAHRFAAEYLCGTFAAADRKHYGTPDAGKNWLAPFVTGQVKSGDYVHVFTA